MSETRGSNAKEDLGITYVWDLGLGLLDVGPCLLYLDTNTFHSRDSRGFIVKAKNGCLHCPMEALVAEALNCREALKWLKVNKYNTIGVESNWTFDVLYYE